MFCGSLDVRGVCTQVYVFLKPFSVHLKLSQYCWLATLQCKIKSEKEVKIWKKGCTHAWYYYYHVLAYRQGILGTTQTLLSLFLPILKHIFMFTHCYRIWSTDLQLSYLFFADIQNFMKALLGDLSSCGKKMLSQKSKWGMKENQDLLQKFKLSIPWRRELNHRAWKWSPHAFDNADAVQWLMTCPWSSCFPWGLWCSLNSHSLYSLFVLYSCGWIFCVCGMGIIIWRGITRWWKWRRGKILTVGRYVGCCL